VWEAGVVNATPQSATVDQFHNSIPVIGLICATLGTSVALALMPDDHRPPQALMVPAIALAIGLLAAPILATIRSPATVFRTEHLLMVGLTYWVLLDLIQESYGLWSVGHTAAITAMELVGLFAAGVWFALTHRPWRLPGVVTRAARADISPSLLYQMVMVCGSIALFRFALPCSFDPLLMVNSLLGNRWSAPWARGDLGGLDAFIDHLSYFGYLLPTMTVLLAHRTGSWLNSKVLTSVVLSVVIELFLMQGGGRRILGVTVGSATICWVLLRGRKIRLITLAVPAVLTVLLLVVMQTMVQYRGVGYGRIFESEEVEGFKHLHVDDNFLRICQIVEIIPNRHPHTYEKPFVWAAIRPIPRALWPGKPMDNGFNLPEQIGSTGASLSSSVLGELYLSFGWPTVLLGGWMFGRLAGMCNQFLTLGAAGSSQVLMYAISAMAIFVGLRSIIELVLMSYMLLAWLGLVALFNLKPASEIAPAPVVQ
jgi:hypothetical protein